jgi:hypothetical protein
MGQVRCYVNLLMLQYALSYFLSNGSSLFLQTSEHWELIRRSGQHNVDKLHKQQFVGWFECKVRHTLYDYIMFWFVIMS